MKSLTILVSLLALSQFSNAEKRSHKAHVHGEGKFTLAIEGHSLEIEMEIPSDDIVGFEHKPSTAKQKKLVRDAEKTLRKANEIVVLPEKAKCKSVSVDVKSPLTKDGDEHHEDEHHHGKKAEKKEEESHSEFHIAYKFKCDVPKYLSRMTLGIFSSFPSLKELNGQAVTMDGQFSRELTPSKNSFSFVK